MNLSDKLLQSRDELEKNVKKLTGRNISIFQLLYSSTSCGCSGITTFPRGLKIEDIEVFKDYFVPDFKNISEGIGIIPKIIATQTGPDGSEIMEIKSLNTCQSCQIEYSGAKERPWPSVYIIYADTDADIPKNKNGSNNLFSEYRANFECDLRDLTGKAVYIVEFGMFVLYCGCVGLVALTKGLNVDDINEKMLSLFRDISTDVGIDENIMYAAIGHGTSYVESITLKQTCEICQTKYEEGLIKPDLIL